MHEKGKGRKKKDPNLIAGARGAGGEKRRGRISLPGEGNASLRRSSRVVRKKTGRGEKKENPASAVPWDEKKKKKRKKRPELVDLLFGEKT